MFFRGEWPLVLRVDGVEPLLRPVITQVIPIKLVRSAVQLSEHSRGFGNGTVPQDFGFAVAIDDFLQPGPRSDEILRQAMMTMEHPVAK